MNKCYNIKHALVLILTLSSTVLSALVLSYDTLPDVLRDSLPVSIKSILTVIILLNSVAGALVHIISSSNKGYNTSSNQRQNK